MKANAAVFKRLPIYLQFLRGLPEETVNISAAAIARDIGYGDVQVRKDLALVSGEGKPKTGYEKTRLIKSLEDYLGYSSAKKAVIIGAGKLGLALMDYKGFNEWGLEISAAFDNDEARVNPSNNIFGMESLSGYCEENGIKIGIIAVPAQAAQEVCDRLCEASVKAIWSFAPVSLKVPDGVTVQYENMAASVASILCGIEE